jgi:hypothetical protein
MFGEKLSQFLLFPRITVHPLPREMPLCLVLLLYIINALEVAKGLVSLHLSTQPTWPQLYACFICYLFFPTSPIAPQLTFLGQTHAGCKI